MADLNLFGQRIKQLRQELGLSQRDFAEKISVTASALSAYEKGQKNPSVNVAINIAIAFNVSLDWLCGIKNIENKFETDQFTPFDLIASLSSLVQLQNNGLLKSKDNKRPIQELIVVDDPLQEFLYEAYQIGTLLYNGSLSEKTYNLCIDELTVRAAESIKEFRKERDTKVKKKADLLCGFSLSDISANKVLCDLSKSLTDIC